MGTINTRISIRSSNTFRNAVSQRHDRTFSVEPQLDTATRLITANSAGSPYTLMDGADFYDSAETGDTANQVYVFIRNNSTTAGKTITVQFNDGTNRHPAILISAGEFTMFPWKCGSANSDIEVFSNDSAGVRVEYIVSPMR